MVKENKIDKDFTEFSLETVQMFHCNAQEAVYAIKIT